MNRVERGPQKSPSARNRQVRRAHAYGLIGQVGDLLFDYQRQQGGVFSLREVPAGAFSRTVVERVPPFPHKVPLLVADALVAPWATLEQALFAEVEF